MIHFGLVVICWKIRIFAYWTTPFHLLRGKHYLLWFAEKFVSLLIEQHPTDADIKEMLRCDLLKNSYLCLLNNTGFSSRNNLINVVICWKIRIFAYWTTPESPVDQLIALLWFAEKFVSLLIEQHQFVPVFMIYLRCDLLKNSYLCLLNNTYRFIAA